MNDVRFKRLPENPDLPLPSYATPGAAGMDMRACLPEGPVTIEPGRIALIPTGFAVELPSATEMQIRPRSGLATKHGLLVPNSPGTVDEDYRGPIKIALLNAGPDAYTINHADRIAQAVIADVRRPRIIEVTTLSDTERGAGGFGSTGIKD
ncbi:deoxyuridine 5'-triphosphate nucleotidohydrolase [Cohaesibacter marisflavi]|uniref:Deoxyuridine 5'-triphosphate nucleotidohydrolase n=1 Tax=Cohaesibacter marisflavi TaxID=655353 RepID=A0A1I5GRX5_9HYPH|nr:dUTP diphosphatase [Cohaesibacter marisflavi]SFO38606.1 deoxyuridine 5'-triphosphate nucleotidohydrolase [Cohaesibacter marisflavi]